MTPEPIEDQNESESEIDRLETAMKNQLRKDVASWSASRADAAQDQTALVVHKPPSPAAVRAVRAARQKAKPVAVAAPVPTEKKPFQMSYDGRTDRAYNADRTKLRIK